MDCARAALRLGGRSRVAYRGPAGQLRAAPKELALAREEGVEILLEHRPIACEGDGLVAGVRFATPAGERLIPAQEVILALGQQPDPPPWLATLGVVCEADGRIRTDALGRTTHPKLFAGGDGSHGPDLAVTAMAAGRRAAETILAETARRRLFRQGRVAAPRGVLQEVAG